MKEIITREEAMKEHKKSMWWFCGNCIYFLILTLVSLLVSTTFAAIIFLTGMFITYLTFYFDVIAMQNKMIISELRLINENFKLTFWKKINPLPNDHFSIKLREEWLRGDINGSNVKRGNRTNRR